MGKASQDCRAAAARCLAAVVKGSSLTQQIPLFEINVSERDRPLFRQLCYGVMRFYPKLIAISQQLIKKPMKDKDQDVLMLILLGIYQLSETRIPDHAAVSATVNAIKALKKPWARGLTNGVLRQWQRDQQQLIDKLSPAAKQSHPQWLHEALHKAWPEQADAIESANNEQAPMCLRVNQQKTSTDEYLAKLEAQACEFASHGIRLEQAVNVDTLPGFNDGWASVQDEAPQLSAALLVIQAGQNILDACCAPGGKTCHLLEAQPNINKLIALDIDSDRLTRVQQNLDRLQLFKPEQTQLISGSAAQPDSWWDGESFDRILLDAPCSATGVIRRNPDIKLHRTAQDIQQLAALQHEILEALWPTLKPGGLLLYATCSVLPEENSDVVERFCQQEATAQHQIIDAPWGNAQNYGRQLFPISHGHDGFFYALLKKIEK